jgi:hypothetical protein
MNKIYNNYYFVNEVILNNYSGFVMNRVQFLVLFIT